MKKSVISTGIALVVLTAGIQFWGYHQVKTGNLYQDQLHAAQKEIGELEDEIQTEQFRIQEIENDLGRIGDELTLHENAAKLRTECYVISVHLMVDKPLDFRCRENGRI